MAAVLLLMNDDDDTEETEKKWNNLFIFLYSVHKCQFTTKKF